MDNSSSDFVMVPAERLKALEAAAAKFKELEDKKKDRLNELKLFKKENPDKHNKQCLESYHRNKDLINEKRRAIYKAKKETEAAARAAQAGLGNPPASA